VAAPGQGIALENIYSLNAAQTGAGVRIYAGTEPAHIYVSVDVGETWRELPSLRALPGVDEWTFPAPPHVAHLKGFAVDPLSPSTVYAGVEVGGLFKSLDGGEHWRKLKGFDAAWDGDFHRLAIRPGQSDDLYLSGGSGVWHSGDAGEQWEHLTDREMRIGYPDGLIVHPDQQNLVFIAGAAGNPGSWRRNGTADAGIGRSRDGGQTWDILSTGLPDHIQGNIEAMSMNLWAGGFSLFATGIDGDVFSSDDEGDTWAIIARGLPPVSKGTAGRSRRAAAATEQGGAPPRAQNR